MVSNLVDIVKENDGSGISWYWMRDGERVADIRVWAASDRLRVPYRYRRNAARIRLKPSGAQSLCSYQRRPLA